jgi:hypothetical protein
MQDRVARKVVQQGVLDAGMVVPVVECARAREEVKVLAAGLVPDMAAQGAVEYRRPPSAVAANFGL